MFKFYKPLLISMVVLWFIFIFHIIGLEVLLFTINQLLLSGVLTLILLLLVHIIFITYYIKNKKKIKKLKQQYLVSLKPDKPLRFCPTDNELLKSYKEQEKRKVDKKTYTKEFQNTEDEELIME